MKVSVAGVDVVLDGADILGDVSVDVAAGEVHGVIGPNGSGKSTLLRCLYRSLKPVTGVVRLGDADVWRDLSARQAARRRAIVAQDATLDFEFTVRDVVAMGRSPHKAMFERDDRNDAVIVDGALAEVGLTSLADRVVSTLSGGERQRVFLARALAQQAPILVLDEPTNHLDVRAQLELLELVRSLGLTTVVALHDLDHAASLCGAVTVMKSGRVVTSGPPAEVLTTDTIRSVFGVRAHVGRHPLTNRLHITVAAVEHDESSGAPSS